MNRMNKSVIQLKELLQKGYATFSGLLPENNTKVLIKECNKIITSGPFIDKANAPQSPKKHFKLYDNQHSISTLYNTVNRKILGVSKDIDLILEELLSSDKLKEILSALLGPDYKLYTCMIRSTNENSSYVGMHQDSYGQLSMAILLNDVDTKHATTNFLEGSHLYPFNFGSKFESVPMRFIEHKMTPGTGKTGDICFFFNKTFHGMQESKGPYKSDVLMCSFIPPGYRYDAWILPDKTLYEIPFKNIGCEIYNLLSVNKDNFCSQTGELVLQSENNKERLIDGIAVPVKYSINSRFKSLYWSAFSLIIKLAMKFKFLRKLIKKIIRSKSH